MSLITILCIKKDCANYITVPLRYIVNLSLNTGIVLSGWKEAKIVPIYKSGASSSVENYRPRCCLVYYLNFLRKRFILSTFLERNNLLMNLNLDIVKIDQLTLHQLYLSTMYEKMEAIVNLLGHCSSI